MHAGFLHPNGVDLFGYSTEIQFSEHLYRYYTFGFPSLAAIGLNYYQSYTGDGVFASMGTGLGFLNQGNVSVGYQWQVLQKNQAPAYIKFGVGYAGSLVFNGAYPVISFEQRLP